MRAGDERAVLEALVEHRAGDTVEERDVGAGVGTQPRVRVVAEVDARRVDDDQLRATRIDGAPQTRCDHGMVRAGIAADDHEAAGVLVVVVRIARGAAADLEHHGLHRRAVAEARAVVDAVGPHEEAHELLEHVAVLVRPLRRGQRRERAAVLTSFVATRSSASSQVAGCEFAIAADQRLRQPVGVVYE